MPPAEAALFPSREALTAGLTSARNGDGAARGPACAWQENAWGCFDGVSNRGTDLLP
jgi:hypothetical protein